MKTDSAWLSISAAAKLLGVHISTLRRWSDQGLLEYLRTPGGKRKFRKEALVAFIDQYRSPVKKSVALAGIQDLAISRTRQQLQSLGVFRTDWYRHMTEEQRLQMRTSGDRLVALMLHYSASVEKSEVFLEEGGRITREYGRVCRMLGVDLIHCVETFLLFRQPILNAIHETGALSGLKSHQNFRHFEKLNLFLDSIMLTMIEEYQHC